MQNVDPVGGSGAKKAGGLASIGYGKKYGFQDDDEDDYDDDFETDKKAPA